MYQVKINREINEIVEPAQYNEQGIEIAPEVRKADEVIQSEEEALKANKRDEIQAKIDMYEAAKLKQLQEGGAGPVADFEIMKICNEYNGKFEIIFK